mgnify:CR=1 FL=1
MTHTPSENIPPAATSPAPPVTSPPALRFDWQDWLPYLENENIPLEQKKHLIEILWTIVITFADLGANIKFTHEACGQDINLKALLEGNLLTSDAQKLPTDQPKTDDETEAHS